ncbi:MAG TPA: cell division ATP-binding protein FtsE [Bacteroidetes bacterium]|nr:ATP-binding cassette domain-containing protein [Ignavibacteria bacterium]HCA41895.1 cell division ATP-binding protein FtsE [Bacteroidota bacterium]
MLKFENVSFGYPNKNIFSKVNLFVNYGEFLFLVGESGIGKTTLLKLIYSDLKPTEGDITFEDFDSKKMENRDIPYLRRKIGIVFQDFKLLNDRNIFENIALPLYISGVKEDKIKKRVFDISSKIGIFDKLNNYPYDLSGGEQQRVSIARAMINEPKLLLADEPTGNLDPFISLEIVKLINEINTLGTAVIFATHNFDIVKKMRDKRILQIKENKLFEVKLKI